MKTSEGLDLILPEPFFDGHTATPERRLMLAVLEDSLRVLLDPRPQGRRGRALRSETERWMAADDWAWPYSLLNVCQALAIDPAWLRERVSTRREARHDLQTAA
jgi:hypothetical protein